MKTAYINGYVHTVTQGIKEAFVVEGNQIIEVGSTKEILGLIDSGTQVIDLEGKFVTAGFDDSHMHVLGFGYALGMVNLAVRTKSLEDMKETIGEFIEGNTLEEGSWVRGRGWNHDYFMDSNDFPTRYDLDKVSTEYPMCMIRACGHICVVNSKALEVAGITKETMQVEGGVFDIDDNGEPLGIFRENALGLIYNKIPTPSKSELKEMIKRACKILNMHGVTSAQTDDFIVFPDVTYREVIEAYKELEEEGELTVRIYEQAQLIDEVELQAFLEEGYTTGVGSQYFKIGPLKMLGDGSLGARTAYMSEPYADDLMTQGIPVYNQEQFDKMIALAHNHGMQVAVHAIGDGIMHMVVEAIEKALIHNPRDDHRHGIVHCQITTPELLKKFKENNLCAYIQSIFLDYDINIVEDRVGRERAKSSYNFKTLLEQGNIVGNGSDCPVEMPNVMEGIQCAVTRTTLDGKKGPYLIEQALTVEEAIQTYTIMGAQTSFEEDIKGSIEVGKVADIVILSHNPFEVPADEIKNIQVEKTMLGGKIIFER